MKQSDIRQYCVNSLSRYWSGNEKLIEKLPISEVVPVGVELPVQLVSVDLPLWAGEFSVSGCFLIPSEALTNGTDQWENINWWYVVYWYLNCLAERKFEADNGALHSYSYRLKEWDDRMWKYAWVNRIAMFLRLWVCKIKGIDINELFLDTLKPEIYLTHDLDAVSKTFVIRLKQGAFNVYNALKSLKKYKLRNALVSVLKAVKMLVSTEQYWFFHKLIYDVDRSIIVKRIINVYGGGGVLRTPKQILFDPGYDVKNPRIVNALKRLSEHGFDIGLHQSFAAWGNSTLMIREKAQLENALGIKVTTCRQHWLRFSFEETWRAQCDSGLEEDTTLGFNDRPGFRNGAALKFQPLSGVGGDTLNLMSVPMILMDSHLYDYQDLDTCEKNAVIDELISELELVKGQASILWHPHTLGNDYGWGLGFQELLKRLYCSSIDTEKTEVNHDL